MVEPVTLDPVTERIDATRRTLSSLRDRLDVRGDVRPADKQLDRLQEAITQYVFKRNEISLRNGISPLASDPRHVSEPLNHIIVKINFLLADYTITGRGSKEKASMADTRQHLETSKSDLNGLSKMLDDANRPLPPKPRIQVPSRRVPPQQASGKHPNGSKPAPAPPSPRAQQRPPKQREHISRPDAMREVNKTRGVTFAVFSPKAGCVLSRLLNHDQLATLLFGALCKHSRTCLFPPFGGQPPRHP